MKTIALPRNGLFLLSGPAGSGKTSLLKRCNAITEDMVISKDQIRMRLFGTKPTLIEGVWVNSPADHDPRMVHEIAEQMVTSRLKSGLPTFIDATLLNDKRRRPFVKLAENFNAPCYILLFDYPEERVIQQNLNRMTHLDDKSSIVIPSEAVKEQFQAFERTSNIADILRLYPDQDVEFCFHENRMTCEAAELHKIDVIGDTHGLKDSFLKMVNRFGYVQDDVEGLKHPDGRKLLLLGDFCDRGKHDLEMIGLAMKLKDAGHYVIKGNHENKLERVLKYYLNTGRFPEKMTMAASRVMARILREEKSKQDAILNFLNNLPHYYLLDEFAFCHSPVSWFDPIKMPTSSMMYGDTPRGSDVCASALYDSGYEQGVNRHILIHGHIPHYENDSKYIFSLDNHVGRGGDIHGLALDQLDYERKVNKLTWREAFNKCHQIVEDGFDFDNHANPELSLLRAAYRVQAEKNGRHPLLHLNPGKHGMLLLRHSKGVHFNNLFHHDPILMKARGLVIDSAGHIIQHVFDKVFNYKENNTGSTLGKTDSVIATQKMNGFFGAITKTPFDAKNLLATTTGSFENDFTRYIHESLTREQVKSLHTYFRDHDLTLMFEIIHPNDPHIIKYDRSMHGAWLIGARGKGYNDPILREDELDLLAEELGFRRPNWERMSFEEALQMNHQCTGEGYMIRLDDAEQKTVMKLKTPSYLRMKFLSRLSDKKSEIMFKNFKAFRQNIEEEGALIAERITNRLTLDQWKLIGSIERQTIIEDIIEDITNQIDTVESNLIFER